MKSHVPAIVGALALIGIAFAVVSPQRKEVPQSAGAIAPTSTAPAPTRLTSSLQTIVEVARYLPRNAVVDGSVDYTGFVQKALDDALGRPLVLPPFPILVSPPAGRRHCLLATRSLHLIGGPQSELRTDAPAVQLLRIENTSGILLDGLRVNGSGGVGRDLHHGLIQITNCANVEVRSVRITDADADAIAVANSSDVRILGCTIQRGSKAGIYVTNCTDVVVDGNVVLDTVGHIAPGGQLVGAGILLLSNTDTVCSDNVVDRGVGVGIVCGSNDRQRAPDGVLITGNRVRAVSNPQNPATSGGIQLANSQVEKRTHVLVSGNSIRDCGQHAILVENHDGAVVQGNSIVASLTSAIVVGRSRGVIVEGNTLTDINSERRNGQAGVFLHPHAAGCVVRRNEMLDFVGAQWPAVIDRAQPGVNRVE
jgi:parallel beta-helix repeat protein